MTNINIQNTIIKEKGCHSGRLKEMPFYPRAMQPPPLKKAYGHHLKRQGWSKAGKQERGSRGPHCLQNVSLLHWNCFTAPVPWLKEHATQHLSPKSSKACMLLLLIHLLPEGTVTAANSFWTAELRCVLPPPIQLSLCHYTVQASVKAQSHITLGAGTIQHCSFNLSAS